MQQTRFSVNSDGSPAQGDRTVFRSLLFDKDDKNQVGETDGTCTTTTVENGGGQLSVQGMVFGILTTGRPTLPPPSFDNAITGGTGEFDQARGQVHADTIGTGKGRCTIDLDR